MYLQYHNVNVKKVNGVNKQFDEFLVINIHNFLNVAQLFEVIISQNFLVLREEK